MENLTPRQIQKSDADRLNIKPGWYGVKVSGTLVTGPCASKEDCLKQIAKLTAAASKSA
jgi:hypothetical protein